jgi:hypothetical protein
VNLKTETWSVRRCECGSTVCKSYHLVTPDGPSEPMNAERAALASAAPDLARAAQKFLRARGTVDHVVRQQLMDAVHQDIEAALHKALNIEEPTDNG